MKDSHTETEVKSKAAEESELVSRQRNAGGEEERGGGGRVGKGTRTRVKNRTGDLVVEEEEV